MKMFRVLLFVFALTLSAHAQQNFVANLTTGQEPSGVTLTNSSTGLPRPTPFGTATFTLNASMTQLTMTVTINNIDVNGSQTPNDTNDNLGNAHIHGGAPAGMNAGVVWGFFGNPFNNNNPGDANFGLVPFSSGVGGTFTMTWDQPEGNAGQTLTSQLNNLFNGLCYINFHTTQNTGGEIRGQIVIPEPSTIALLGVAALGLGGMVWRRRRN